MNTEKEVEYFLVYFNPEKDPIRIDANSLQYHENSSWYSFDMIEYVKSEYWDSYAKGMRTQWKAVETNIMMLNAEKISIIIPHYKPETQDTDSGEVA